MIHSIALIHLVLVLYSQMARLSNRGRRQRKTSEMRPLLGHSSFPLPVPGRGKATGHPQQPQGPLEPTRVVPPGPERRVSFRLTHRRYQGPHHSLGQWVLPTLLVDADSHSDQDNAIWKDRKDWLQRLRPRPPRGPALAKKGSGRRRKQL